MTGYRVNTGSNTKYSSGWDQVFGDPKRVIEEDRTTPDHAARKPDATDDPGTTDDIETVESKEDAERHRTAGQT